MFIIDLTLHNLNIVLSFHPPFEPSGRLGVGYPGSGVVLDCIDSWSLHLYLLLFKIKMSAHWTSSIWSYMIIIWGECFLNFEKKNTSGGVI